MHPAWGLLVAYVAGSIPAAYIAGRLVKGIDLRQHGSGNLGATNVYRLLGAKVAVAVLLFDAAKGGLPVHFLPQLLPTEHKLAWQLAYGVAAILGHVRSLFLLWKGGGKGVATASGVFFALVPLAALIATTAWALVLWTSGYVSLASLTAAVVLVVAVAVRYGPASPYFGMSVAVGAFVFWTHRANIGRLRRGEEHRFGRRARVAPTATPSGPAGPAGE